MNYTEKCGICGSEITINDVLLIETINTLLEQWRSIHSGCIYVNTAHEWGRVSGDAADRHLTYMPRLVVNRKNIR